MVRKILIIDDDEAFVATMSERLDYEGYEVVSASDGDLGLDAVEKEKPDLVVLDIMMPKLNGYAFLKMLKSRHPGGKIAVVICTARGDVMDAVKSEGISGFLVKPFDPAELVTMVNVTFQLEEAAREKRRGAIKAPVEKTSASTPAPETSGPKPAPVFTPKPAVKRKPEPPPPVEVEDEKPLPGESQPPEPEIVLETPKEKIPPVEAEEEASTEKPRVLIIDDEKDFVEGLKDRLSFEGFEVYSAYNGQDGLDLTRKEKPNLILLDVMMPKIDGYMVCRLLKFDEKYQSIPIIMLTARSLDEDRDLGLSSGADDYITKPIDFEVLLKKIKSFVSLKPSVR